MAHSVVMPELGESVTEGTITQWLKAVGDTVSVDEPLLEVSTDKVDTEVPSPVAGVLLEIRAEELRRQKELLDERERQIMQKEQKVSVKEK